MSLEKNEKLNISEEEKEEEKFEGDVSSDYSALEEYENEEIYPADIKIGYKPFSIEQLFLRFQKGGLITDPEFQRSSVWGAKQKRELIESILMGLQIPSFYFSQTKEGNLIIVDGKQRLKAIFDFYDNRLSLDNLKILKTMKGKKFKNLDGLSQANFQQYTIGVNVIEPNTPDRIMYDIFDRINRGGTPLNNQEVRNAIYQGKSTELLKKLADSEEFGLATNNAISSKRMKDKYIILRFLAFYLWKKKMGKDLNANGNFLDYKSDMNDFLGKTMEFINSLSDAQLSELENIFYLTMNNIIKLGYEDIFRLPSKPPEENNRKFVKRPVNMPLFETICYLLSENTPDNKINDVVTGYKKLITDSKFVDAITIQVDNIQQIKTRFDKIDELKKEIF